MILKEVLSPFIGKKILAARGNAKIDIPSLLNKKVLDMRTWGKQFFIRLKYLNLRVHFLMFGSYSINDKTKPDKSLRLHLKFRQGDIYFYTCSVKMFEGNPGELLDWEADIDLDQIITYFYRFISTL